MNTIQVRYRHVSSEDAYADVAATVAYAESVENLRDAHDIAPETAVTIASWWQAPSGAGYILAGFASGAEVDRTELLDDIAATRETEGYYSRDMESRDRDALDCLSTFVINYER